MRRLTRDGIAEPVSQDQMLRRERGQGKVHSLCSANHEQDWQPYPVDPYSCYNWYVMTIHTRYTQEIMSAHPKRAVVIDGWPTLSFILQWKFTVAGGLMRMHLCADVFGGTVAGYRARDSRAGLVCGFYLKLFGSKLLYCGSPLSVRSIRARAYSSIYPNKIYKINRISPRIKKYIFFANPNKPKTMPLLYKTS